MTSPIANKVTVSLRAIIPTLSPPLGEGSVTKLSEPQPSKFGLSETNSLERYIPMNTVAKVPRMEAPMTSFGGSSGNRSATTSDAVDLKKTAELILRQHITCQNDKEAAVSVEVVEHD